MPFRGIVCYDLAMDLAAIHHATKIPLRKLRYVLDHGILPGMRSKTDRSRVGHPRSFAAIEGFSIALAVALLEGGLRRDLVARFLDAITQIHWETIGPRKRRLTAIESASNVTANPAIAEIADGRYLRLTIGKKTTTWSDLRSAHFTESMLVPCVVIRVDMFHLRDQIRKIPTFP